MIAEKMSTSLCDSLHQSEASHHAVDYDTIIPFDLNQNFTEI